VGTPDFSQSPDIVLVVDASGRVLTASRAAEERLSYPPGGLDGADLASLSDDAVLRRFFAAPPSTTARLRSAVRLLDREGRPHAVDAVVFSTGASTGWIFVGFPLHAGAEARGMLDALIDSVGATVWAFDPRGTITAWSAECESYFGFTRPEAEGQLAVERLFARPEELRQAVKRVDERGRFSGEALLAAKGGEVRPNQLSVTRLGVDEERPLGYACVAFDVADRKRTEELNRALFERVGEAILVVNADTLELLDANTRAAEILGYARDELLRLRIPDLLPPGERSRLPAIARLLEETGRCEGSREPYRRKDGAVILCDHTLRRIEVGGCRYVLGLIRDVTAQIAAERELREAKAFMERLQEEASDGFAVIDDDGRVLWANRALAEFRGVPRDALVGTHFLDFAAPSAVDRFAESFQKLRRGEPARLRVLSRGRGGQERTVDIHAVPLERGGRRVVFAAVRDVSEQARAEEDLLRRVEERTADLRRSEERFRLIAETMPVAMATTRMDGTIVYVNEAGAAVMRVPRTELPGRNIGEFYADAADRPKLREALLRDRAVTNWEFRLRRGDGSLGWGLTSLRIGEYGGDPVIFGCFQDLTALKSAEDALRLSETRFRNAFENMGIAACLAGPDSRFLQVNRALCGMLGYSEEELLARQWKEVTHPEDLEEGLAALRRMLSGEISHARLEKRYLRKDGGVVWGIVTTSTVQDAEGRPLHFVTGIQDITDMKRAEEALRDAHDAMERRVEERTTLLTDEIAQRRRAEEHLKLYREIFRHAPEAIAVVDRDGRMLERNEAYGSLFARPEVLPAERFARLKEGVERQGFFEEEKPDLDAAGRSVDVHLSAFAVRTAGHEVLCYVITLRDVTARKRREGALHAVLEGTSAVTSDLFFRSLVRTLCAALGVRAAFVFRVLNPRRVQAMAGWIDSDFAPEQEYDLAGTPCEGVMAGQMVVHPRGIRSLYPSNPELAALRAESYVGVPILDPGGEVAGHLSVIDDEELEDPEFTTSLLRLFAGRAGAEMVRMRAEAALRESEERWRSLVANVPSIVLTVDRDWRIQSINRIVPGLSADEIIGTHVNEYVAPEGRDTVKRALEGVFATGLPTEYQVQAVGADRTMAWYETRVGPIVSGGKVVGATLMATDITVRRETERRLAALADEQSLVLSQMRDFLYRHDTKGVFTFISPAVEQITGRTPEEWRTHYTEYLTENPINRAVIESTEETLRTGRQSPPYLVEVRHKDGRPVLLEVNERAYFEDGKIAGVVGVARDVTERRKAEDALQFQKTLLESQSEAAIDGILVVSMKGSMISFNRRFLEMWDIPRDITVTRDDESALRSVVGAVADPARFLSRVRYLYDHPEEESRDEVILKDGRVFDRYSAPVRSRDGVLYGRVWYFRDVTGRKRTEQELRRAAEETRRAYEDLKRAQGQLIRSEKLASIGILVSGVAHEINNPLNVMYGNLQLLQEASGSLTPRYRNMIRDALKAGGHARRIMDDFRGYARDARMAEPVDLNQCLEEAVALMKPGFRRRVKVVKRLGRIPPVRCFRGQMSQVFLNLLKNAVEAVDKRGTLTLRTRHRAGRVIVEVADTGRGMSEEIRSRLFEPFFTTKPVGKGLGLGLSISAMILQNHGGRISVKSRPGKGSVFIVEIPVGGA
jgi:PAS domain S-box-containing protein